MTLLVPFARKADYKNEKSEETKQPAAMDVKELLRSMYGGENKRITDGNSVTLCRWMVFGGKKVAQAEVVATIVDGEKV